MARFLPLTVTDIHRTIRDAVVLTLAPETPEAFRFTQGQYLTFRHEIGGQELRRNYSICSGLDDGALQVGIKRVADGAFSTYANDQLNVGDVLHAMPPAGRFFAPIDPDRGLHYVGFAGGSGITPVLSILRTVLAREPLSRFTLIYANRAPSTVMFRDELDDLKNRHMDRLSVLHVLESGDQDDGLFAGRVDAAKCAALFGGWIDVGRADMAFICGPEPMMRAIAGALEDHGMPKDRIRFELFGAAQPGRAPGIAGQAQSGAAPSTRATLVLDGTAHSVDVPQGRTVLDAALAADLDVPFACKAGVCSTCRAKLRSGQAEMLANHALEDDEVRAGYVLTCQAVPVTAEVTVDYDQH